MNENQAVKSVLDSYDDKTYLEKLADTLRNAYRESASIPNGTEGSHFIRLSDELANVIADRLEKIAEKVDK